MYTTQASARIEFVTHRSQEYDELQVHDITPYGTLIELFSQVGNHLRE